MLQGPRTGRSRSFTRSKPALFFQALKGRQVTSTIFKVAIRGHVDPHRPEDAQCCCKALCFSYTQIKQDLYPCAGTGPFVAFVLF